MLFVIDNNKCYYNLLIVLFPLIFLSLFIFDHLNYGNVTKTG